MYLMIENKSVFMYNAVKSLKKISTVRFYSRENMGGENVYKTYRKATLESN